MKNCKYFQHLHNVVVLTGLLVLAPTKGSAESLTNNDGVVYENVTVISVTPKDLLITYSSNGRTAAASVPLKSLPLEVQQRYGYSSNKEDAYKDEMARKDAANAEKLAKQTQAATNSTPRTPHVKSSPHADKASVASPTVDGGLTDEEIKGLNTKWTDNGITYSFTASMSRPKLSANEQKKYMDSGRIPFTISMQLSQQSGGQKKPVQITDGNGHFYIFDSDGNVIVEPHTDTLLKLCRH